MPVPNDTRRRLLVALALERSRGGAPVEGALRRALEGERRRVGEGRVADQRLIGDGCDGTPSQPFSTD